MHKLISVVALVGAVAAGTLGATGPASAADAVVVSPTNGAQYRPGDTVTFSVSGTSTWSADVSCDDGTSAYADDTSPSYVATNDGNVVVSCTATVTDTTSSALIDTVGYTVAPPAPKANEIRRPGISGGWSAFYPRVRDGYRDAVEVHFGARANANVTMTVVNSSGRVVRTIRVQTGEDWDTSYWPVYPRWNGRNASGTTVPVGAYRLRIVSSAAGYATARATLRIQVSTGWRTVRTSKSVPDAYYSASDSHSSGCYIEQSSYPDGERLDCWGGRYAQATYHLRIPSNAVVTDWWATGSRGCCSNGRVIKSGVRTSSTRFRIRVRVTNWASFTITDAGVSYRYRARI